MTTDTEALTYDHIVALALENGFKLKPQVDGRMALNDYVIDFARAVYGIGRADAVDAARAEAPMAMVQCHGSAEHPLYTADQLAAAVAAARISALCDTLLNRPARNAGLESEYAAEAAAKAADVGEPVAFAHFAENGNIRLWAPERPRDLDGNAAHPLYTADQLAAAVAKERERAARVCERIADDYNQRERFKYAELKTDAETGANECADAIRAGAKERGE